MSMTTKITKEEFDRLYDENITVKEHKNTINKIDNRFKYIMKVFDPKAYDMYHGFDYSNGGYNTDGDLEFDGEFDLDYYKNEICYIGESSNSTYFPGTSKHGGEFPTRWLWEDFEEEYKAIVQKIKDDRIAEAEALRLDRLRKENEKKEMDSRIMESVKSKLTKEEFEYLPRLFHIKG